MRTVLESEEEESQSEYVGLVIGILLTMISLLLAGIFFVIYRGRRGKETPTHSLLAAKIQDKITASIDFQVNSRVKIVPDNIYIKHINICRI